MSQPQTPQTPPTPQTPQTTGLQENVAGLLCYVLWWVSGIVFLILEPNNKNIKFHAYQSILVFGVIWIAGMIISWIPFIGWVLGPIIWFIGVALWIALMYMAYQGRKYKMPWAGALAEKWVENPPISTTPKQPPTAPPPKQ
jgi:uncharacterized membrane protein